MRSEREVFRYVPALVHSMGAATVMRVGPRDLYLVFRGKGSHTAMA